MKQEEISKKYFLQKGIFFFFLSFTPDFSSLFTLQSKGSISSFPAAQEDIYHREGRSL
jgi:hypothetical protein